MFTIFPNILCCLEINILCSRGKKSCFLARYFRAVIAIPWYFHISQLCFFALERSTLQCSDVARDDVVFECLILKWAHTHSFVLRLTLSSTSFICHFLFWSRVSVAGDRRYGDEVMWRVELHVTCRRQQNQPDRQLPPAEHDAGRAEESVRQHRRHRVLQDRAGQNHRCSAALCCFVTFLSDSFKGVNHLCSIRMYVLLRSQS